LPLSFPSAREMVWPISLAAFSISAFAFPLSGAHSQHGDTSCQRSGLTPLQMALQEIVDRRVSVI
jgi:hypothetical protein